MKISIPNSVKELSKLFPCPLYAVGGFVRDSLLGYDSHDVDLTSPLPPDEVKKCLAGTPFVVKDGSKKLLTLVIGYGEERYEYTTFRWDSYTTGHRPEAVTPCTDITTDARRRDFTVNAIYYDIGKEEVVDPLDGLTDLHNKVLRTTRSPRDVFSEDGLRLMRLARFAASLGFTPTEETLSAAKQYSPLINDITKERIREELDRILVCDTVYGVKDAHVHALQYLLTIGVLEKILPDLTLGIGMEQRSDYHAYDVFTHIIMTVRAADPSVRLAALFHDIAKPRLKLETGSYKGHDKVGGEMTREIMSDLRYSAQKTEETARLVEGHMFNLDNDVRDSTMRRFILKNKDILDKLLLLKFADMVGSGRAKTFDTSSIDRIAATYEEMKGEKVPFSLKDLLVTGEDLKEVAFLPENKRGEALKALLSECVLKDSPLKSKEKQLDFIRNYARRGLWTTT